MKQQKQRHTLSSHHLLVDKNRYTYNKMEDDIITQHIKQNIIKQIHTITEQNETKQKTKHTHKQA